MVIITEVLSITKKKELVFIAGSKEIFILETEFTIKCKDLVYTISLMEVMSLVSSIETCYMERHCFHYQIMFFITENGNMVNSMEFV